MGAVNSLNRLAAKFKDYPIQFWFLYTSEGHPEFIAESSWALETYDARRQRARSFLWMLDYLGTPLQMNLLVDNNLRREIWQQFPFFSSEVRAKYGWLQGAWIIDADGKLVGSEPATEPPEVGFHEEFPLPAVIEPCRSFWPWRLEFILNDIFELEGFVT